ncbi:MAG: hypothetical protein SNG14_03770 [Rikenellaceae bacterium]
MQQWVREERRQRPNGAEAATQRSGGGDLTERRQRSNGAEAATQRSGGSDLTERRR